MLTDSNYKSIILSIILGFSVIFNSHPQLLNFRNYGVESGICNSFVYTINQDPAGFMWFGAGPGLCRFNGLTFLANGGQENIPADLATSTYTASDNRMWFGFNNGQITVYDGRNFTLIENEQVRTTITGFHEDPLGNIIVASQRDGLIRISKDMTVEIFSEEFSEMMLNSVYLISGERLLAGTSEGLFLYEYDSDRAPAITGQIEEIPAVSIKAIKYLDNQEAFLTGTNRGVFKLYAEDWESGSFSAVNAGDKWGLTGIDVEHIFIDNKEDVWLSTFGNGAYRIVKGAEEDDRVIQYSSDNGLPGNMIKQVFQDNEGIYWFATYGNGISLLNDEAISIYPEPHADFGENVLAVAYHEGYYWLGGEQGILKMNPEDPTETGFFPPGKGLPRDEFTALAAGEEGTLWAGTHQSGLYRFDTQTGEAALYFSSRNSSENSVNYLLTDSIRNELWMATNGGVFRFNLNTGETERLGTDQGLPYNFIRDLHQDSKGYIWAATRSKGPINLTTRRDLFLSNIDLNFTAVAEDKNGDIWAATDGNGAIKIYSDTIKHFTIDEGLASNYCYSLITDHHGYVWIGHRHGISRINTRNDFIRVFGNENGIEGSSNYNSFFRDRDGKLLFGTTKGLVIFDGSRENAPDNPPIINITSIQVSDDEKSIHEEVILPYGSYRLRIDFIGLDYTNPEQVKYRYKLEGYDFDWSSPTDMQFAYYPRIDDGEYTFLLRAYNSEGMYNEEPFTLNITIGKPLWKKWYFYLGIALIIGISLRLYVKIREHKLRKEKEHIENELAIRTKEVVKQRDEIETKNRDITDSINYAQRIQASILPSFDKLQENFSSSFIFYQPRDIVSGDFYWFDMVNKEKFVVVCADSTGHGVPGAFMSMIGTTLIKDICMRKDVNSPADVLKTLDMEITSTLNQNIDKNLNSVDGMDITVCEIDVKTKFMRFASAMRPIIILQNSELIYLRGSRNSIGGFVMENKTFDNQSFQLNPGDIVYMFSDGFPDQFGGPHGKKFKMVKLKNLISDICDKQMEDQYKFIKNNFYLWKGDHEQVDDVLFMGIKV